MEHVNFIRTGQLAPLQHLVAKNPNLVNLPDERGFTPLVLATYMGQKEIAELLIDHGANVNAQDAVGNTALMGVSFKGSKELVEMLLARGADIELANKQGDTALSFAKNHGHEEIVELLENHSMSKRA
ncbi:ankyrin repeat domain-containing protein [Ekhidna sp.]|uniref:ankyrin repeat domain-containing protein n=1 Tax=Ekhidna sp. TaxID=2608089 RepID=UPI003298A04A